MLIFDMIKNYLCRKYVWATEDCSFNIYFDL